IHFWLVLIGMTLAFFPMHYLGIIGMPRRIFTYHDGMGWDLWNLVSTIGAFTIAVGVLVFLINLWQSMRNGEKATNDPWDGATLEWKAASPPAVHNFDVIPIVRSRRPFWDEKHGPHGTDTGAAPAQPAMEHFHMPSPSIYPIILAFGVLTIMFGLMYMKDLPA